MEDRTRKPVAITIKGDPSWREWVEIVAQSARVSVAVAIEHALIDYAKKHKVTIAPPQRLSVGVEQPPAEVQPEPKAKPKGKGGSKK